jgi:intracellular multiplication protein IcmC
MSEAWYSGSTNVLHNLAQSLLSVEKMLTGGAYLMGIAFALKAVMTLKSHGEQRSSMGASSLKESGIYFFVAAMLLYYPTAFEVIMNSTFGYSNVLAYATLDSTSPILSGIFGADNYVGNSLTIIIQVVGLVAFIRGWLLIARSSSQGQGAGNIGKGMMHVFGGVFAININGTLVVFHNTFFGIH